MRNYEQKLKGKKGFLLYIETAKLQIHSVNIMDNKTQSRQVLLTIVYKRYSI